VACLVPTVPHTGAFWGLLRSWSSVHPDRVHSDQVYPGSPAAEAGLHPGDWVLKVDDHPADADTLDHILKGMRPGSEVRLLVDQEGRHLDLKAVGVEPEVEAVYYYDVQLVALLVCVALAVFLAATRPLRPTPWWRALAVLLVGLAGSVLLLATFVYRVIGWHLFNETTVWRQWLIDNEPPLPRVAVQAVCSAVALGLLALGILEVRAILGRRVGRGAGTDRGRVGALVKLLCATEATAGTEEFRALGQEVVRQVIAAAPINVPGLLVQKLVAPEGGPGKGTVGQLVQEVGMRLGEAIVIAGFTRFEVTV
jgi:hypothetical protein